jgi:hypothetical protein
MTYIAKFVLNADHGICVFVLLLDDTDMILHSITNRKQKIIFILDLEIFIVILIDEIFGEFKLF